MADATDFEQRIDGLDTSLFHHIDAQSSTGDRKSLLFAQRAVRNQVGSYSYLEIGSHLGGSIQPHIRDPRCRRIYSIDKRPLVQPDDRGHDFDYPDNSTQRMLKLLRPLAPDRLDIIQTFDCDASEVDRSQIQDKPDLCFIDGEHTHAAVVKDFAFCRSVASPNAVICFHDRDVIDSAIQTIVSDLRREGVKVQAIPMAGEVYAIGLGDAPPMRDPMVRTLRDRVARTALKLRLGYEQRFGDFGIGLVKPVLAPLRRFIYRA